VAVATKVIRELLENGVHFGHQTNKWNPKMKKYIFGAKSGIYIIDLQKTEKALKEAEDFVYDIARQGKRVLFVGTKKQGKQIIRDEAERCDMFYVDERWLGGCLTNFQTIRRSVERLNQLQEMKDSEIYDSLAKKEQARKDREESKLLKNLGGIRDMEELPDCVFVVDAEDEFIAIKECRKIDIPVIALLDTNGDPDMVDYPIPGNDDAIRSIRYIVSTLADAAKKGRDEYMGKGGVTAAKPEKGAEKKGAEKKAEEAPAEEKKEEKKEEKPAAEEKKEEAPRAPEAEKKEEAAPEVKKEEEKQEEAPAEEKKEEKKEEKPAEEEEKQEKKKPEVAEGDISLDVSGDE
jgi:small subunit ribosomal protein S2